MAIVARRSPALQARDLRGVEGQTGQGDAATRRGQIPSPAFLEFTVGIIFDVPARAELPL